MVDKILKVNDNLFVIVYAHKPSVHITSDDNTAFHLIESLLGPRYDMTYTEYIRICSSLNEDTAVCNLEEIA